MRFKESREDGMATTGRGLNLVWEETVLGEPWQIVTLGADTNQLKRDVRNRWRKMEVRLMVPC